MPGTQEAVVTERDRAVYGLNRCNVATALSRGDDISQLVSQTKTQPTTVIVVLILIVDSVISMVLMVQQTVLLIVNYGIIAVRMNGVFRLCLYDILV